MKKIILAATLLLTILLVGCIEIEDIISVEFSAFPKTTYVIEEELQYFTVKVTTADGTEELNSYSERLTITGFDTTTIGTRTMTIVVDGVEDASINFVYTVVSSLTDLLFAGGQGTEASPYEIETPQHLSNIRFDLDAHYKLVADIDLSGITWDPIGTVQTVSCGQYCSYIVDEGSVYFTGELDGAKSESENYKISHLSTEYTENFALFYGVMDATIENIDFYEVAIHGFRVGSLAVYLFGNTLVENINISGEISSNFSAGGLIFAIPGLDEENVVTEIKNVVNTATITGLRTSSDYVMLGGLVAQSYHMGVELTIKNHLKITDSFNYGNITHVYTTTVDSYIGQLIGQATEGSDPSGITTIHNSGGTGTIIGNDTSKSKFYGYHYTSEGVLSEMVSRHNSGGKLVGNNLMAPLTNLTFTGTSEN